MDDEQDFLQVILAPSTLQFSKAYLTFARLLFKIHYLAINHPIVEALIELIKLHMKYFERTLQKTDEEELKDFIMKNVDFSLNYLFRQVDELYRPKLGNEAKYFKKIYKKFDQLKEIAECKTHF
jgi:5'-deoxynucleotidase YfbR-like HD superfamily hydrolase